MKLFRTKHAAFTGVCVYLRKPLRQTQAAFLLFVLLLAAVFAAPDVTYAQQGQVARGYTLRAQNEYLALYLNQTALSVAVRVKATGSIWYTNPPDWLNDPRVGGINRHHMQSQLRITYFNETANEFTMNSFFDSVNFEQFEIEDLPDGFRVTYTLGDAGDRVIYPQIITEERMEYFRQNMSQADWVNVTRRYLPLENGVFHIRPDQAPFLLRQLHEILEAAGYTREDMEYDHYIHGVEIIPSGAFFVIPIVYRLDGPNLLAYIPTEDIYYPQNFPLARIIFLEFFGAAGEDVNGYMFIPDGSGSLIYLNNGRTLEQQFMGRVYGRDQTFFLTRMPPPPEPIRMPVFGIRHDDKAMFAIIEDGDAFSTITTRVSGIINSYNSVFVDFMPLPFDHLNLAHMGDNMLQIFQDEIFEGAFRIRFAFLDGEEANYSGMAGFYQNYLVERGMLTRPNEVSGELPFVMEALGAIQRTQNFMGIPYQGTVALTTFDQTITLLESLQAEGINNLALMYSGWMNGGMHQRYANSLNVVRQLGGNSGFEDLVAFTNNHNIAFFPEVHINYTHRPRLPGFLNWFLGGFRINRHAARSLDNGVMRRMSFELVTNWNTVYFTGTVMEPIPFIVNPAYYTGTMENFLENVQRFDISGVGTGSLFADLNSAFNNTNTRDRQHAMHEVVAAQEKIREAGLMQLANGANAYAFEGLNFIVNVPFDDNGFTITNASIPFYQMVIRGFIEYTGTPVNISADIQYHLLKTLETGSGIYVQWMYEDNSIIRDTHFTRFFAHNYARSFRRAVDMYHEAATVLNRVQGQRIVRHEILTGSGGNLRRVTYENGVVIWVNFDRERALTYDGVTVGSMDFAVFGG